MGITYTQEQVEEMFKAYINIKTAFQSRDMERAVDMYYIKVPQELRDKIRQLEQEARDVFITRKERDRV